MLILPLRLNSIEPIAVSKDSSAASLAFSLDAIKVSIESIDAVAIEQHSKISTDNSESLLFIAVKLLEITVAKDASAEERVDSSVDTRLLIEALAVDTDVEICVDNELSAASLLDSSAVKRVSIEPSADTW